MARFGNLAPAGARGNLAPAGARERVAAPVDAFGSGQEQVARGAGLQALGQGLGQLGAQLAAEEKVEQNKKDRLAFGAARTEFMSQHAAMEAEEAATRGVDAVGTRGRVEQKSAAIREAFEGKIPESQAVAWQSFVDSHKLRSSSSARQRETKEINTAMDEQQTIELAAIDEEVKGLWAGAIEWQSLEGLRKSLTEKRGLARSNVADRDGWSPDKRSDTIRKDAIYVDTILAKKIAGDWREMGLTEEQAIEHLKELDSSVNTDKAVRSIKMEGAVEKTLDEVTGAGGGLPLEIDGELVEGDSVEANFDTAAGRLVQREAADRFIQNNYGDLSSNDRLQIQGVVYSQLRRGEVARDNAYREQIVEYTADPESDLANPPTGGVWDTPAYKTAIAQARAARTSLVKQRAAAENLPSLMQSYDRNTDPGRVEAAKISALLEALPAGVLKNHYKAEFTDILGDDLDEAQRQELKDGMFIVDQALMGKATTFKRKSAAVQLDVLNNRALLREKLRTIALMEPGKEKDAARKAVLTAPQDALKREQMMERLRVSTATSKEKVAESAAKATKND
jgi:hypothetical protein